MEDKDIIDLYLSRDEQALEKTAEKYGHYLFTIAMNVLLSREDSEECVNDAYLSAWSSIPPNQPKLFSAYLANLVRNAAISLYRKKHSEKRIGSQYELSLEELSEVIPGQESVEKAVESAELSGIISRFLKTVGRDARNVFLLRYYYHDSVNEIAVSTGFTAAKVKVLLHRTRRKLKAELEKEGYGR